MKKDWKTTLVGVFGTLVMLSGVFMPETFDEETQQLTRTAFSNIVIAVGSIVTVINAVKAKDPK